MHQTKFGCLERLNSVSFFWHNSYNSLSQSSLTWRGGNEGVGPSRDMPKSIHVRHTLPKYYNELKNNNIIIKLLLCTIATKSSIFMSCASSERSGLLQKGQLKCLTLFSLIAISKLPTKQSLHIDSPQAGITTIWQMREYNYYINYSL